MEAAMDVVLKRNVDLKVAGLSLADLGGADLVVEGLSLADLGEVAHVVDSLA